MLVAVLLSALQFITPLQTHAWALRGDPTDPSRPLVPQTTVPCGAPTGVDNCSKPNFCGSNRECMNPLDVQGNSNVTCCCPEHSKSERYCRTNPYKNNGTTCERDCCDNNFVPCGYGCCAPTDLCGFRLNSSKSYHSGNLGEFQCCASSDRDDLKQSELNRCCSWGSGTDCRKETFGRSCCVKCQNQGKVTMSGLVYCKSGWIDRTYYCQDNCSQYTPLPPPQPQPSTLPIVLGVFLGAFVALGVVVVVCVRCCLRRQRRCLPEARLLEAGGNSQAAPEAAAPSLGELYQGEEEPVHDMGPATSTGGIATPASATARATVAGMAPPSPLEATASNFGELRQGEQEPAHATGPATSTGSSATPASATDRATVAGKVHDTWFWFVLLIFVGDYTDAAWKNLEQVGGEHEELRQKFMGSEYQNHILVDLKYSPTGNEIDEAFGILRGKIANIKHARVLIWCAGHGEEQTLIASDGCRVNIAEQLDKLSSNQKDPRVKWVKNPRILTVCDHCRSVVTRTEPSKTYTPTDPRGSDGDLAWIHSTGFNQEAVDGLFFEKAIEVLDQFKGRTLRDIFREVKKDLKGKQRVQIVDGSALDLVLFPEKH